MKHEIQKINIDLREEATLFAQITRRNLALIDQMEALKNEQKQLISARNDVASKIMQVVRPLFGTPLGTFVFPTSEGPVIVSDHNGVNLGVDLSQS